MPDLQLNLQGQALPLYLARPEGGQPGPGVVVLHDALGMSTDLRRQCDWLAGEGFLAAAPDLFAGGTLFGCIFRVIREIRRREGRLFDQVEAVREHLEKHPDSNGRVGVIGFCFGGGFVVLLAAGHGFDAASINYGGALPRDAEALLAGACPVVASYGALDRSSRGVPEQLEEILSRHGIPHDVKEYANTDHAFLNDHDPAEVPLFIRFIAFAFGGGAYHEASAQDARRRITAFFNCHLR